MRSLSVRFKREVVCVAVLAALLAVYLPFEDSSWSLYAALCISYTILVFGLLWSDGKWRRYVGSHQRTPRDLTLGHTYFLLALIFWIWICRISRPWLPGWFFREIDREPTWYVIFGGLGVVALWWAEQSWLAKPSKKEEKVGVLPQ